MKQNSSTVNLTSGSIPKQIIAFAVPIFLGNLFQQLYNVIDSLIVGNFISSQALAAVSSTNALIFSMIGFFNGMSIGAGVVVARYYGSKDEEGIHRSVHTTAAFGLAGGLLITILGTLLTPQILVWMKSPADVLPQSVAYLRIYFMGILSMTTYNCQVGILQSVGDSRHPLYYLIVSSVLNAILDLFFVGVLHQGVWSAALATVIAQGFSSYLCFRQLSRVQASYRLELPRIRFYPEMVPQILRNGLPAGIQNSIISVANVVVQSSINSFGSVAMAGCGAYSKIQGFVFLPIMSISNAITTFISQNLGAKQPARAKKGAFFGIGTGMLLAELFGVAFFLFAATLTRAFSSDPAVIDYGVREAHLECLFFFLLAFSHLSAATLRGYGKAVWPTLVMMFIWCGLRVPYIVIGLRFVHKIEWIFSAYPVTWSLSSLVYAILLPRCFRMYRDTN